MNETIRDTPTEERATCRALVPVEPAATSRALVPVEPAAASRALVPVEPAAAPAPAEPPSEHVPIITAPGPPDTNPAAVYLNAKASSAGRRGLEHSLARAAKILTGGLATSGLVVAWSEVRYQHVKVLSAVLQEQLAPATVNHVLAAVRGTMREAWRLGQIDAETLARVTDVANVPGSRLPAGRHLDAGEIVRLFNACGDTPVGARDAAMLALLYGCGLRRSEAVAVQLADYDDGAITIRHGKGNKERVVYCQPAGQAAVVAWIARRGAWPGALLCPVGKGGHVKQRAMTTQAVLMRLRFLADKADVARFSPHDLRRTFVGEMLAAGADISFVQQLAGHAAVSTTARYDRRPEHAKREAAARLPLPYRAPKLLLENNPPPAEDAEPAPDAPG